MRVLHNIPILILISIAPLTYASNNVTTAKNTCVPGLAKSSQNYDATMWYRDSAEKIAQYNQVFTIGFEKIKSKVNQQHLKHGQWGVILDIDETVLDNSQYQKLNILSCNRYSESGMYSFMEKEVSIATPGASNLTCSIQELGGQVILITNRNGNFDDKIQSATIENLRKSKVCFDNVIFAKSSHDNNKNPRFEAARTGNYEEMLSYTKLPPLKVIAYFGDNIQDFPNTTQKKVINLKSDDQFYKKFGEEYFSLPNPTYGSWQANQFN